MREGSLKLFSPITFSKNKPKMVLFESHSSCQLCSTFVLMEDPVGWNDFSLPACGEWYDNEDGTSRQDELRNCVPGEVIHLLREPENEHDHMAVALVTVRGIRVGYLRRDRAVWIGSKIDRGYDVRAIVERVKGSHLPDASLGLVVRINMEGDEPELPDHGIGHRVRIPLRDQSRVKFRSMVSDMVSP